MEHVNHVSMITTATESSQPSRNSSVTAVGQQQDSNNNKPADDGTSIHSDVTSSSKMASHSTHQQYKHPLETIEAFKSSVDQVLHIWPHFSSLKGIDPSSLDTSALNTIRDILRRLVEQWARIRTLQDESRTKQVTVQQLEKKCIATDNELTSRTKEINDLTATILSLKAELETHTSRTVVIPEADYEEAQREPPGAGHRISTIDITSSAAQLSDLDQTTSGAVYRRPSVLGDVHGGRQIATALEQQQMENITLRRRLKMQDKDARLQRRGRQSAQLVQKYERLEDDAIGKLYKVVKNSCPSSVSDERRSKFICAVIETAYAMSLATRIRFEDVIANLLLDPTKLSVDVTPAEVTSLMSSGGQLPTADYLSSHASLNLRSKQNRSRYDVSKELKEQSDLMIEQLDGFIDSTSDVIDLSLLVESVVGTLKRLYPDCCQPSLVGHTATTSVFNQFVSSCCLVAWQMATAEPQFHLATTLDGSHGLFNPQLHNTLMQEAVFKASIDHYLWPVLFDQRNGQVLYRGRVVLNLLR
jgi:hypothetical protein